jgi:hypothetical protein
MVLRRLAVLTVAVTFACATSRAAAQPSSVEDVLRVSGRALGVAAIPAVRALHTVAHGKVGGIPATVETWSDLTARTNASYVQAGPLSGAGGYDGRNAWQEDAKGVVWVDGSREGRGAAVNEAYRESYALWRADHGGAAVVLRPRRHEAGRTYDVLRVTPPGGLPFDLWLDAATHLPARTVESVVTSTTTTTLSGYRRVAGLEVATVVHQRSTSGTNADLTATQVRANPPSAAAKLRQPVSHPHDFGIVGGGAETTIPFKLVDNHIYLDVKLNGKGPYHFELDTGGANFVDPAVLREIGAAAAGSAQGGGVGATTVTSAFGTVRSLRVGRAELRDQIFLVAPVRAGFGLASSAPVDGLIGFEVLARFLTTVDYQHRTVTLRLPSAAATPSADPGGTTLPFVFDGTQPQVTCTIDGITGACNVDTGSRTSIDVLTAFVAAHPAIVPSDVTPPGVGGFGVGGPSYARLGRLGELGLGSLTLNDLVANFDTSTKGFFGDRYVASNIGGGVWKRFTVTFDYPRQRMTLVPNDAFAKRDTNERAGAFVVNGKAGVRVVGVRSGTPAARAGLAVGDTIVRLNGERAPSLAALRGAFLRPVGTRVTLVVVGRSGGHPRTVTFTLRDYV